MAGASSGAVALRNLGQKSISFSKSFAETAPRVLSLQRDFLRSVSWIKRAYNVPKSEKEMRSLLTGAFREKQSTADITLVNRYIVLGRMELEETLMLWKGQSHVVGWFENAASKAATAEDKPPGFLDNFFAGKA
jgi:hypothetical protein